MAELNVPAVGLAFLLSQVGAYAAGCFEQLLSPLGVTPQHAGLMRMLGSNPGMSQQAMAKLFGILPSRLVVLLDELEGKGFVTRRADPGDRRSHRLHLTAAGSRGLRKIGAITRELEADLLSVLSPDEQARMAQQLQRVVAQQKMAAAVHPAYRTQHQRRTKNKERESL